MASVIPNDAKKAILNNEFDWSGNTYKLALLTSTYTPDIDNDTYWSDISTNEVSGTGYTAGGSAVSGLTVIVDDTNDLAYLDATDLTFSTVTVTFRYAVLYEDTGTPATSKIVAVIDPTGTDRSPYAGDYTITWATDGVIKLT